MGSWDAPPTQGPLRFGVTGAGQPASVLGRIVAFAIDWVIIAVAAWVVTWIFSLVHLGGLGWLLSAAISLGYWTYFWGSTGQTLGYRVMHIRAVTMSGEQLGYGWAFLRGALVDLSFAVCLVPAIVSLIMMAVTEKHQALHDLILGTTVVNA
jgi:uncharacterized RDD family membrane protein YckC